MQSDYAKSARLLMMLKKGKEASMLKKVMLKTREWRKPLRFGSVRAAPILSFKSESAHSRGRPRFNSYKLGGRKRLW